MTAFKEQTFKQKVPRMGDYHSYWLTGAPKDGSYYHYSELAKGENLTTSHKPDRDGKYRSGGSWLMQKKHVTFGGEKVKVVVPGSRLAYSGMFCYTTSNDLLTIWPVVSIETAQARAEAFGAQGRAAMKADAPDFTPVTSVLELRDVLPMVRDGLKEAMRMYRKAPPKRRYQYRNHGQKYGSEFLGYAFGWIPLIKDAQNFIKAFHGRDKRVQQLLRDNGRPVRRERVLLNEDTSVTNWSFATSTTQRGNPNLQPTHVTSVYGVGWTNKTDLTRFRKVWVAGRSRYYLPPGPPSSASWQRKVRRRIMGARVTPAQVYAAIPWSWLVGYFADCRYFLAAVSPGVGDRTVVEYAYIMDNWYAEAHSVGDQLVSVNSAGNTRRITAYRKLIHTQKARVGASIFGWGLKQSDLTPFQIAVMGALGASKL